jgi:hypothetical protein
MIWAGSSVGLERAPDKGEAGGSSPPRPTIAQADYCVVGWWRGTKRGGWGRSSVGRAAALHAAGHRFEPGRLHQYPESLRVFAARAVHNTCCLRASIAP